MDFTLERNELLVRARQGDRAARSELLEKYRQRLRQMIDLRIDRRLCSRVDPSDVVQETLAEAHRNLDDYLEEEPLPIYPWLRQFAANRLADLHRRHLHAVKRSVLRESIPQEEGDGSVVGLADWLVSTRSSPSRNLIREEVRGQVQRALLELPERDREILVLRYLESMATDEIAAVLGISIGAVKVRHLRALERIRPLIDPEDQN